METILFAEDEAGFRYLTERILVRAGYHLIVAKDGHEAVESARSHDGEIHMLVTNVIMPRMDGIELSRIMRKERPDIRVLFVTSGEHREFSLLRKPFTGEELLAKIREILDSPMAD